MLNLSSDILFFMAAGEAKLCVLSLGEMKSTTELCNCCQSAWFLCFCSCSFCIYQITVFKLSLNACHRRKNTLKFPVKMLAVCIHFVMQLTCLIKAVSTQGACMPFSLFLITTVISIYSYNHLEKRSRSWTFYNCN